MIQFFETISCDTKGPGLYDITHSIEKLLSHHIGCNGLLTIFLRHTSASLLIQENADPDVLLDLEGFMQRIVSRDSSLYRHTAEGPDDMPSHIRTALTQSSLNIPVQNSRLLLGTWQAVYIFEHRDAPHRREAVVHFIGD